MKGALLKHARVAVSLVFLTATAFIFVDFTGALSSSLVNGITWIQFVPSILKFTALASLLSLGFLVTLIATLLFGRVYCSTVCPLGILQDVISRLSGVFKKLIRKKTPGYRFAPEWPILRNLILAAVLITFFSGTLFLLNLLDPFSLFGKIFAGLFRPLYYAFNNLLADFFQSFGIYTFYLVETRQSGFLPFVFPLFMLLLIGWMAAQRGRLFCNTICPVGTLLGWISKYSMYRIHINESLCNNCAFCALNCKAQCIDLKTHNIDFTRCVGCFNCLNVCSKNGIDYKNYWFSSGPEEAVRQEAPCSHASVSGWPNSSACAGSSPENLSPPASSLSYLERFNFRKPRVMLHPKTKKEDEAKTRNPRMVSTVTERENITKSAIPSIRPSGITKRDFLFRVSAYLIGYSAASRVTKANAQETTPALMNGNNHKPEETTIPEVKNYPVSPPGSTGVERFKETCTACQLCVSVCPSNVLQPSFLEYGFTGMMLPRMDFHASFCNYDCVKCTEICPTGALIPLTKEEKHQVQVGEVRLELQSCVVVKDETACGACAEHCPTQAVKMVSYKKGLTIPMIEPEYCVGCGGCEYICPTRPFRAIYVDGNKVHKKALPPVIETLDYKEPEDDFPF